MRGRPLRGRGFEEQWRVARKDEERRAQATNKNAKRRSGRYERCTGESLCPQRKTPRPWSGHSFLQGITYHNRTWFVKREMREKEPKLASALERGALPGNSNAGWHGDHVAFGWALIGGTVGENRATWKQRRSRLPERLRSRRARGAHLASYPQAGGGTCRARRDSCPRTRRPCPARGSRA